MNSTQGRIAALMLLAGLAACKSLSEELDDLHNATDDRGRLELGMYDAGLLVHEGCVALLEADEVDLAQLGRVVHDCALILDGNEFALCRADAVSVLSHIAARMPLKSALALESVPQLNQRALDLINRLDASGRLLEVPALIVGLEDADRVVAERALRELRTLTGEKQLGPQADAWKAWWEAQGPAASARAVQESQEPLQALMKLRFATLSQARACLGYVAARAGSTQQLALRDACAPAITSLARQVLVLSVQKALADADAAVRWEAYRAAEMLAEPQLMDALGACWSRETSVAGQVRLLRTWRCYPGKSSLTTHLLALGAGERAVALTAWEGLQRMTGEKGEESERWWLQWYERSGKTIWP